MLLVKAAIWFMYFVGCLAIIAGSYDAATALFLAAILYKKLNQ